ncbi:MAG TPA: IS1182 family transposase [Gaiellaceae bacterium]|jgi:transposase
MSKAFREWKVDQVWLLPPSVQELVPPQHVAHFVRDIVREELDLSAILATYAEERGYPPFHPAMMTALLLYAYTQGVYSSRRIARACAERVDFMAVTAMQKPDFRTVAEFRRRHLPALEGLFKQVLKLCQKAGLVKLGHVALDGTKVKANASKHKAMSYGRMLRAEAELQAEVARWFAEAEAADTSDEHERPDRRGDELPAWVVDKQRKLEKIREARAALEKEAAEAAEAKRQDDKGSGGGGGGGEGEVAKPKAKAQRNFTDPESRILKTRDGYIQGYNAQLAVDAASQIIVAHDVVAAQVDCPLLPSMLAQIRANTGQRPAELSADQGYLSEANVRELKKRRVRGFISVGRQKHGSTTRTTGHAGCGFTSPLIKEMARRVSAGGFRSRYRLRKQTVEPVHGQIKEARGFRHFSMRGTAKARGEWSLVATVHNLLKLAKARST